MSRRLSFSLTMLAVGLGLLVASALARPAGSARAGEAPKGGTLRIGLPADVDFVDPALAYRPWSWPFGFATCAKLFNYPDAPGAAGTRLMPEVVDRFTVSRDRRTYTFELKQTFRFHTGARVTAQSFADALNRVAQPKLESPAIAYMREIVGAASVIDGKAQSISGVRVLGRYRLQIRLTRPVGDFTARLTMPFFCPVLPHTPIAELNDPAGSGPYYVYDRVVNQRIVLKRNPFYRGDRPANVDQVVYTISESQQACQLDVEQDRTDQCTFGLSETDYRTLAEKYGINRPGGQFFVAPRLDTWFVAFNHDRRAFNGPGRIPLEKAINYAIDRPELARAFGYLAGKRTDQLLPPDLARPDEHLPAEGRRPGHRKEMARAGEAPAGHARPLCDHQCIQCPTGPGARPQPQADRHRPRGEVLRRPPRQAGDTRGALRPRPGRMGCRLRAIRPRSSSRFSRVVAAWASTSTTHASTRESRPRTA